MIDVGVLRIPLKAMQNCTGGNILDVLLVLAKHFKLSAVEMHSTAHCQLVRSMLTYGSQVAGIRYRVNDNCGLSMHLALDEKRAEAQRHA